MPAWLKAVTAAVREVVIPLGGAWGILFDRPLDPKAAAVYAVMMGLLPASALDRFLAGRGSTGERDGPPSTAAPESGRPT
jgi:hypothetical protein